MNAKMRLIHLLAAFSLILALVVAPLSAQPATGAQFPAAPEFRDKEEITWEQLTPEIQAKVDRRILQELQGEVIPAHRGGRVDQAAVAPEARQPINQTRFIVYLKDQTDLKAVTAQSFATTVAQRNAVVDALIATAQQQQGPIKALLNTRLTTNQVAAYQSFYVFNGVAVEGDWNTVMELVKRDEVKYIAANYPLIKFDQPAKTGASPTQGLGGLAADNWNIDLVDADRVWNELGITGTNVVVAGIDTGVDWTHPALQPKYRGYAPSGSNHNYNWFDPNSTLYPSGDFGASRTSAPFDTGEHGTHTMGTMVTVVQLRPMSAWLRALSGSLSLSTV